MQVWLQRNRCSELVRARYESTSDGKRAAILVAVLRFPESVLAGELNTVADQPGSGAIADASTEGTPWPGKQQAVLRVGRVRERPGGQQPQARAGRVDRQTVHTGRRALTKLATSALEIPAPA